ncbi:MAG: hypothetical protein WB586_03820, partial [Chthoniobacterales bacterium]
YGEKGLLLWPQSWGDSLLSSKPGSLLRFLVFGPPTPIDAGFFLSSRSALRCLGSVRLSESGFHRVALKCGI